MLVEALRAEKDAAVRLYLVDTLGMIGHPDLASVLEPLRTSESNRDVLKHIGYAVERDGAPLDPKILEQLASWDVETMSTAVVGRPAPDFELPTTGGKKVRLSDFRGKAAVVLVFIYGDT